MRPGDVVAGLKKSSATAYLLNCVNKSCTRKGVPLLGFSWLLKRIMKLVNWRIYGHALDFVLDVLNFILIHQIIRDVFDLEAYHG